MNELPMTAELLRQRLSGCLKAYKSGTFDVASLRSPQLAEAANRVFPESCHTPPSQRVVDAFGNFLRERARQYPDESIENDEIEHELFRPRALLVTNWSLSVFDGSAESETDGFLDADCMPPWGCWLGIRSFDEFDNALCLVSWIPKNVADKVDMAILADPAQCMSWLQLQENGTVNHCGWGERWR